MTTRAEGELLSRVGPGTPMGNFMREYWVPAALSSELTADGPPMRLMLLGRAADRLSRSAPAASACIDHRCPHRGASLFFGRNEKEGLRCVYHGWKFDVDGNCLDMPNVPKHPSQQDHRQGLSGRERNGLIWTYMGARKEPPPLPMFESVMIADDSERNLFMVQRECSYLQALEGDIDTSHLGFLHMGGVDAEDTEPGHLGRYALANRAPEYHVADTDWGTMYSAYRPGAPGEIYWRFAHFMFPFWTIPPDGHFRDHVVARAWVPMDDTHTMFVHAAWKKNAPGLRKMKDGSPIPGMAPVLPHMYVPNDTSWFGRWRLEGQQGERLPDGPRPAGAQHRATPELTASICRIRRSPKAWAGSSITSIENLAISDLMITRTRRRILRAVQAHVEGIVPPGVDNPETYQGARGGDFASSASLDWLRAYSDEMRASNNPTGALRIAAE